MSLRHASKIGQTIPSEWREGENFSRGGKFAVGDLVILLRSDGAMRYGEITNPIGPDWQNAWEVAVTVTSEGAVAAVRAEEGAKIFQIGRAAATSAAAAAAAPQAGASPPKAAEGGLAVLLRMGTQRVIQEAVDQLAAAATQLSPVLSAAADQISEASAAFTSKAGEELRKQMEAARGEAEARQDAIIRQALQRKAANEAQRADLLAQRQQAAAQKEAEVEARRAAMQASAAAAAAAPSFTISESWDSADGPYSPPSEPPPPGSPASAPPPPPAAATPAPAPATPAPGGDGPGGALLEGAVAAAGKALWGLIARGPK